MLQSRPFFTLISGFALVGALVVVAFLLIARQAESTDLVIHTLDVQNRLTTLLSRLQDAETGQRGFLLTGDTDFLQPYESALTLINQDFTQVKEATADNSYSRPRWSGSSP